MGKSFLKSVFAVLTAMVALFLLSPASRAEGASNPSPSGRLTLLTAIDPLDPNDKQVYYAVPEAAPGEKVVFYVPLLCENGVENVSCGAVKAVYPAVLKTPTAYDALDVASAAAVIPALTNGQKAYFTLSATIADGASPGDYALPMQIKFQTGGLDGKPVDASMSFKIKAAPGAATPAPQTTPESSSGDASDGGSTSSGGGSGFRSKPKVILDAYSFSADKLYAGEQVTLSIRLRNTSAREAVKNLEVKFSNDSGVIMPVSGGSNTVFIGELKKNSVYTLEVPLQLAPDAEVKAQTLSLEISYEGTKNRQEFTEKSALTVPIFQKARVRVDQPQIYDEAWVGQTVSMSVQMFNMGKSTLYNCMVEVLGDGLSLEETYYGGNVTSGSTMRADLTVKTQVAGTIDGKVRITYEDVFGEQSEEILPFTLTVSESMPEPAAPDMEAMAEPAQPASHASALLGYWWVLVVLLAVIGLLILLLQLKRRRARMLEDDLVSNGDESGE